MDTLLTRRQVLHSATLAGLATLFPGVVGAGEVLRVVRAGRILILLEFEGGNDGINTIVPYADPIYASKRPAPMRLTVGNADFRNEVIPFDPTVATGSDRLPFSTVAQGAAFAPSGFGIHAGLEALRPAWQNGELAIVQGVGYAKPNRSHFRGINILSTAQTDEQPLTSTGWLGRMFTLEGSAGGAADGIIQSRFKNNGASATGVRLISFSSPNSYLTQTQGIPDPTQAQLDAAAGNPGLLHLLTQQKNARGARAAMTTAVGTPPRFTQTFPNNDLGRQALYTAQCIAGGLACSVYKIKIGGFDTHTEQVVPHANLLKTVADALAALRAALIEKGLWNNVLITTLSEFGRRLEMNGSNGTDHGTAAPHFFLGGKVQGGFYGTYPSLSTLDSRGDLLYNVDFRQMYATCGKWLGVSDANIDAALPPVTGQPTFTPVPAVNWA
jgi:uncharacterized protein (DUF1501 family)